MDRRSIYRSSFISGYINRDRGGWSGFNWYPGGNMEFAVDRPYDINWGFAFSAITPYCIDYIRRLVYGKDLWDVVEIRGIIRKVLVVLVGLGSSLRQYL